MHNLSTTIADTLDSDVFKELKEYEGILDQKFYQKWDSVYHRRIEILKSIPFNTFVDEHKFMDLPNGYEVVSFLIFIDYRRLFSICILFVVET